jgi:hypothetical protein
MVLNRCEIAVRKAVGTVQVDDFSPAFCAGQLEFRLAEKFESGRR